MDKELLKEAWEIGATHYKILSGQYHWYKVDDMRVLFWDIISDKWCESFMYCFGMLSGCIKIDFSPLEQHDKQ